MAVPATTVRGVIPLSSDAITYMEGNNSGLSQLLLYSVSNPIFCLLVAYLSVGFVLLLCPSIECLLYEAESHGFQEKSPSPYCRHILVLFCFDLLVILLVAYLSVGFVLLLCPSIERLLYEAESHGFQEKSPSPYCRHILVLFCFDLLIILLVAYLSVGFVLLLCPSIERLLYEAESHGFQEKSPSPYCRHILVLFCFDLPVIC